jgi:drug/metabolite transporter (DMT)-like permease
MAGEEGAGGERRASWLPAFIAVAFIWGTSFMFIKLAVEQLPPVYIALGRVTLGALSLLVMLAARREHLPRGWRLWAHLSAFAFFGSSVPFIMFGYAEQHVASVLAGIWNGTVPLTTLVVTLLLARFSRIGARPHRRQILGLLVGFFGVLVVLGVWNGLGGSSLTGQLELLIAVSCYGVAMNYSRHIMATSRISAVQLSTGQTLMSTLQLAIVAPVLSGAPPSPADLSWRTIGSVAALGVLGTGLAFALNFHVINTAGVTIGSMVTYLPPVVAAAAGVAVLGEHLTWNEPVGGLVVLAGVWLARAPSTRRRPDVPAPPPTVAVAGDAAAAAGTATATATTTGTVTVAGAAVGCGTAGTATAGTTAGTEAVGSGTAGAGTAGAGATTTGTATVAGAAAGSGTAGTAIAGTTTGTEAVGAGAAGAGVTTTGTVTVGSGTPGSAAVGSGTAGTAGTAGAAGAAVCSGNGAVGAGTAAGGGVTDGDVAVVDGGGCGAR